MNATARRLTALVTFFVMAFCAIFLIASPVYADGTDTSGADEYTGMTDPIAIYYCLDATNGYKTKYFERNDTTATIIPDISEVEDKNQFGVFCGWSIHAGNSDPSYVDYDPGDTVPTDKSLNLYAVFSSKQIGETLTASGDGTTVTYNGDMQSISGVTTTPDEEGTEGYHPENGYYHLNAEWWEEAFWYDYYAWLTFIQAQGTDVGSYSTPAAALITKETTPIFYPTIGDKTYEVLKDAVARVNVATMKITPATLTVTAEDQRVKYTGSEITPEGTIEGFVTPTDGERENATLNMDPFTEVGEHPMTYSITWGTAKEKNYEVTENLGTLTIYYELAFDANGGEGAPETMEVTEDTATLPSEQPTREDYSFLGWAASADATEAEYQPGATIELSDNTTLYAVWEEVKYVLSYDANGGKEAPEAQEVAVGKEATIASGKPTREGYTFLGWATAADATKAEYQAGDSIEISEDTTLYAVWEEVKKDTPVSPKTGDSANIMLYASLCGASFVTLLALLVLRRRKHQ